MAKRNVVNFRIVNIPDDDAFKQLKKQGKVDPNAMYVSPDTSLKEKHITNCITEIPQDIKLELNNGTLTLKAGSKVYVPNGSGVFDAVTTTEDVSTTRTDSQDCMVWRYPNGSLGIFPIQLFYSGATAPTQYQFMFWYDTTENKCKITNNYGSTWQVGASFPICFVETDGTKISAIKQVFNGFGYVGATVFALPGVKGLIPNGRNADGSLKSDTLNITSVKTYTISNTAIKEIRITSSGLWGYVGYIVSDTKPSGNFNLWYNPVENIMYDTGTGTLSTLNATVGISVEYNGTRITSFTPKTAFHAVDYNELNPKIVDDKITNIFNLIYPVGAIYIGTQSTCPMSIAIPGSSWSLVSAGRALWTGNGSNANTTIAPGLPNIKGTATNLIWGGSEDQRKTTGALKYNGDLRIDNHHASGGSGANLGNYGLEVDASLSSSIYRDDVNTVQPPAYVVNVWRRTA